MKSATQTANRDFTIPALTTNDSPAMLALQNNYTAINQIQVDADTLLNLYRPVSTTNTFCGLGFFQRNSSNAAVAYAQISNKLITNTSGDEDGKLYFYVRKDGVLTEVMSIDKNGLLTVASVSVAPTGAAQSVITLLNTGAVVTTTTTAAEFDMLNYTVAANQLGLNGALKVRVSGYVIQNGSASGDFTIKVKFGGVIMYQGATTGVSQTATQRPMLIELILGNKNATNVQGLSGVFMMQDTVATTTGNGDIQDDEMVSHANFRGADAAQDTTTSKVLQVTMTMNVSSANMSTSIQRRIIEFLPGT